MCFNIDSVNILFWITWNVGLHLSDDIENPTSIYILGLIYILFTQMNSTHLQRKTCPENTS